MRSISWSRRVWFKGLGLSCAGLFLVLMHGLAQSLMTTYVGPQLPVSGSPASTQAIDVPLAVVPDGAGGFYVVGTSQNRVYAVGADGTLRIVAGSSYGFGGDGGPATDARLASPSALALDSRGNLYIADYGNNRIRKVTRDGVITTIAGTDMAGFSGDGGPATSAQLSDPTGIAVDAGGNVYIADTTNNRIRKVGVDGVIRTVAGGGTQVSGVPATSASLNMPSAVAVDTAGNLYIVDLFAVRRVSPDGIMTTFVPIAILPYGRGTLCSSYGDGGPASAASVCWPHGLAVDAARNLYVTESMAARVRKVTTDGFINTVAGGGTLNTDGVSATTVSLAPFGVAVDAGGSLYIAEAANRRVRKVTPDGLITTLLRSNIGGFAGDGGPGTLAQVSQFVRGVSVDRAGNLYIADSGNNRVRKVTPDGVISTIAGNGGSGFAGDGGPATLAEISAPRDVFTDSSDNIYILADGRVRKVTTDGVINTIAGGGEVSCNAENAKAIATTLCYPQRIAVDAAGTLYIAESIRVRKVGADGMITTIAGNGTEGSNGDGGPAISAQIYGLQGFALDPAGGFYITGGDNRIRKVTPDGVINTIAGVRGICGSSGDGGLAPFAQLCYPSAIALDAARNIYVADQNRIRKISASGFISTFAGNGVAGFSGDGGPPASAQLAYPCAIAVSAAADMYIADCANGRIRKVSPSTATRSFTLAASGADYQAAASLSGPIAVGYGTVQPVSGKTAPSGIAVFGYRSNGVLVGETAVPASPLRQSGRIYAESSGAVRTGIAIANPGDKDAVISFYFTDKDGVNFNSGTTTLPAHEQYAAFLDEAPYHGTEKAQSFTFTSSVPVGAIALRSYVNERGDPLMTTLPVAPLSSDAPPSTGSIILPHFAAGDGWTTQVLLVNPTDQPLSGTVNMEAAYGYVEATYRYAIPPRSSTKIVSAGSDLLRTGNVVITPAQGSGSPIVSSVLTFATNGVTVTETGIATTGVAPSFRVFAESDSGHQLQTGIAIANTTASPARIQFDLLRLDGAPAGYSGVTTVDPNGHLAMFLNEIPGFQSLPSSFRGVLYISSNKSISAIGLRTRYNERGDFLISTTPAIADNTPSSTEQFVFPQVVSGGGYTTEFILMNSAAASQGTLSLTSQTGTELPLFAP